METTERIHRRPSVNRHPWGSVDAGYRYGDAPFTRTQATGKIAMTDRQTDRQTAHT